MRYIITYVQSYLNDDLKVASVIGDTVDANSDMIAAVRTALVNAASTVQLKNIQNGADSWI